MKIAMVRVGRILETVCKIWMPYGCDGEKEMNSRGTWQKDVNSHLFLGVLALCNEKQEYKGHSSWRVGDRIFHRDRSCRGHFAVPVEVDYS